jgi:hypothetical protein
MPKAKIPTKKAKTSKGAPPPESQASANLHKRANDEQVALNFTVPAWLRKEYKSYAVDHDMKMIDLLLNSFNEYKENHK